ncbi:MAG: tRNA (adenosine(37)-N6)-threonylcarbamoyltransferase complex dimerization subunit type 1 TsaB [Thiohalocapsa sp.]
MKLLAIDTSGAACSAALLHDGVLTQRLEHAPRRHGELILSMMDALLSDDGLAARDLDALAFGCGPGSFTGLRIAAAVVQGVAFGAGLDVVGVSTLAALAQGCRRRDGADHVLCAFDARMGEVYWGAYRVDPNGLMRPLGDDVVCAPEAVWMPEFEQQQPAGAAWSGVGSGWVVYGEVLSSRVGVTLSLSGADQECEARDIAMLARDAVERGEARSPEQAIPVYLRNQVTAVPRG